MMVTRDSALHDDSDMGGHSLLATYLLLAKTLALACLPREYLHNGICCPMCDKGSFVKSHCESESSSSTCVLCPPNTYMDTPNSMTECFRCLECDPGFAQIVKQQCTPSSNTVCECQVGHFCRDQNCDNCEEHKGCQPGEYVKKAGTGQTDTVCEKCHPGYFSSENNSIQCFPWQECSKLNLILYKEGTLTTNSICKEKRSYLGTILSFILSPLFLGILLLSFRSINLEKNETVEKPDLTDCHAPVQERGD